MNEIIIHDKIEQPSDENEAEEWFEVRKGMPTASKLSVVIGKGAQRTTYLNKIAAEILTGVPQRDKYTNKYMDRGKEFEDEARFEYSEVTNFVVEQVGSVESAHVGAGCSPDGLVLQLLDDLDRSHISSYAHGVEIKVPLPGTFVNYANMKGGFRCPAEYKAQVQGSMLITGMSRWDFVVYLVFLLLVICGSLVRRRQQRSSYKGVYGIAKDRFAVFCRQIAVAQIRQSESSGGAEHI